MTQYVARGLFTLYSTGFRDRRRGPRPVPSPSPVLRDLFVALHYGMVGIALVLFILVTHAAFTVHHFQHLLN